MHQGFLHYCRSHVRECSRFSTGTFCQCRCLPLLSWPFNIVLCGAAASGRDKQNGMDGFTPSLTGLSTQKRDCQHTNGTVNTQTGLSTRRRDCQHTDGTVNTQTGLSAPEEVQGVLNDRGIVSETQTFCGLTLMVVDRRGFLCLRRYIYSGGFTFSFSFLSTCTSALTGGRL